MVHVYYKPPRHFTVCDEPKLLTVSSQHSSSLFDPVNKYEDYYVVLIALVVQFWALFPFCKLQRDTIKAAGRDCSSNNEHSAKFWLSRYSFQSSQVWWFCGRDCCCIMCRSVI
jgi:hypothetical protein